MANATAIPQETSRNRNNATCQIGSLRGMSTMIDTATAASRPALLISIAQHAKIVRATESA
jgi:hypothetical protein